MRLQHIPHRRSSPQPPVYVILLCALVCQFGSMGGDVQAQRTKSPSGVASAVQFSSANYSVAKGPNNAVTITVMRSGDTSGAATVDYATVDGSATQKKDYTIAVGTLSFAAGETSKTFVVLVNTDACACGNQTASLVLSNAVATSLGSLSTATLTITDPSTMSTPNPIDDPTTFVDLLYHDLLNRQADAAGESFWTSQITSCNGDAACIEQKRVDVAGAFFLSIEFQETGSFTLRSQRAAFGRRSSDPASRYPFVPFMRDVQQIIRGVVVGASGYEQKLEQNKQDYQTQLVSSSQFAAAYPPALTADQYVDALFASAGVTPTSDERQNAITAFGGGGTSGRVAALRSVTESNSLKQADFNQSFVLMLYYGFLRRSPTDPPDNNNSGYTFFLNKLNSFNGDFNAAGLVRSFITSDEYRNRLAVPPLPPPGSIIISEFRLRGPNGALDEFIELYNNTDLPITVAAVDGSSGFAVAASDGVVRFVVPNNTTIPARAHFLGVASGYSLNTYPAAGGNTATGDAGYTTDIPDNAGIALFNTATPANFTLANRLDAVGSTSETNALYKEGTGYSIIQPFSTENSFYRKMGSTPQGVPQDTDNNAADFTFVDTIASPGPNNISTLGAPGPENRFSPIYRTTGVSSALIDPLAAQSAPPNRVRDTTPGASNTSLLGTLSLRRTFTNTTTAPITRLRFRIVDITTFTLPTSSGIADLRALTSGDVMVSTTMGAVTARGTTLEQPPTQTNGGGFNSSLSANTITLAAPLAPGASVSVQFLFGVRQAGAFRVFISTERLP